MMKMSLKLSLTFSFFLVFRNAYAFNITEVLNKDQEFSTFNTYLTQTGLAGEINKRQTITVLAVGNGNIGPLSGKSPDILKGIMSLHVVLDYYDPQKLQKMTKKSSILTTLFQTTGSAKGQQGFLNVTLMSRDKVTFGSALPGSTLGSELVKSVASQPYNFSVLQVSNVIIPQGVDGAKSRSPSSAPSAGPGAGPTTPQSTAPSTVPPSSSESPDASAGEDPVDAGSPPAPPDSASTPAPGADGPTMDALQEAYGRGAVSDSFSEGLRIGLAVVFTMASSSIYLASRI